MANKIDSHVVTTPASDRFVSPEFERKSWFDHSNQKFLPDVHVDFRAVEFEASLRSDISAGKEVASAWNDLGCLKQLQGDIANAATMYRTALQFDSKCRPARRNLAAITVFECREESEQLWRQELESGEDGLEKLQVLTARALDAGSFKNASAYASQLAGLRYSTPWFPSHDGTQKPANPLRAPERFLTIQKLCHDVAQFEYLKREQIFSDEFDATVREYRKLIESFRQRRLDSRVKLSPERHATIYELYNRICYLRTTPRVAQALSDTWRSKTVERQFHASHAGVVVIDDFLSAEALFELRRFCLESTVWLSNRYAYGRLGAFFNDGFNCELLLQIAEEIGQRLPTIVRSHPVRQIWGFKNTSDLPADATTHADFAAINVNFWITPTDANLDSRSGGLVVYGTDAPSTWEFDIYNGRSDIIHPFLRDVRAPMWYVPYRENRCVIFNSDLFHGTAKVSFRPRYDQLRTNVTILYGDRESDFSRRNLSASGLAGAPQQRVDAWRSPALSRGRRGS